MVVEAVPKGMYVEVGGGIDVGVDDARAGLALVG